MSSTSFASVAESPNDELGQKLLRFCGVSVVNLVLGQTLLFMFYSVLGWSAVVANLAAVCISAVPAYLLSRKWVWRMNGDHSMRSEILPFWSLAIAGLVVSTLAVGYAEAHFDAAVMVNLASIAGFAVIWVVKFFILDRVMWAPNS
jgi:putative flippase GtrA